MYLPTRFRNENYEEIFQLIDENPLATLMTVGPSGPIFSHIPLVAERENEEIIFYGHLARANPHFQILNHGPIYAVFHGANHYISPQWYVHNDVPTWNYAVVHAVGTCEVIHNRDGILNCLKKLSLVAEKNFVKPWEFWIPEDLAAEGVIEKSIAGMKIKVSSLAAKFKMNQTRSKDDLMKTTKALKELDTDASKKVADLMESSWTQNHKPKSASSV